MSSAALRTEITTTKSLIGLGGKLLSSGNLKKLQTQY
jgi:hypothetical protein